MFGDRVRLKLLRERLERALTASNPIDDGVS